MKSQRFRKHNSIKTKSIILSVISIIELILLLTTMTLAWFEGLTSLEITGNNLSTASGLKSKFIVGEGTDYSGTAELNEFFHKQSFDKLSPVSSMDGDNFYAITTGEAPETYNDYLQAVEDKSITFRKLSDEEKLSSIIYFQFEIQADSSDTDFWFKSSPTIKIGNNTLNTENNPFRFSIDDGTGAAPSTANNYLFTTCTQWPGGDRANMRAVKSIDSDGYATLNNTSSELIANFAGSCVFGDKTTPNNDGKYKLFTVPKGESKIITVAIWIEAFDPAYNEGIIPPGSTVEIGLEFCSSWDVVDEMVFRDYTADQWVDVTDEDQSNKAMKFGAVNLDSDSNYYYPFTYSSENKQWTADVPRAVQNIKFIWQGQNDSTNEDAKWTAPKRESNRVFTAFGSTAGVWYDGTVDPITFSDYTSDGWVNESGIKMKAEITYEGNKMTFSMTDSPTQDGAGKDTWGLFIPSSVDKVIFNRCDAADTTTALQTWDGKDRNGNFRYYALDGGTVETIEGTAIYLSMPLSLYNKNYNFNDNTKPAITFTSSQNISNVEAARNSGSLQNMPKSNYVTSGNHCDTWPGTNGEMKFLKQTSSNIYFVYYLDYDLEEGTYLTFWSKTHVNSNGGFNNIDNNVSILPAVQYKDGKNQFAISGFTQFTDSNFGGGCYAVTAYQTAVYSGSDGNVVKPGKEQNGQWGAPDLPAGTYQTWFVQPLNGTATSVTATFEYYGIEHTVQFAQSTSDSRKFWSATGAIPDDVTVITFTDNNGNTWTSATSGTRSKSTNYYYATSNSAGKWSAQITPPAGSYKTYFIPPSGNTATTVTVTYTYSGIQFSATMAKGTDGYWSTQAIPDSAANIVIKDSAGHTWTTGTGRTSTNCYYIASSNTAGEWSRPVTYKTIYLKSDSSLWDQADAWFWAHAWGGAETVDVKMTPVSGQSGLYSAEIPEDSTNILFVRMNPEYTDVSYTGKWNQTVDLTIPSDSDTFTITSWDNGTWYEVDDPDPVSNVLYLQPNSNWTQSNARFAAYFFSGSTSGATTWVSMTKNSDGTYQVTIPDGGWTKVIFCRMNPSTTANNWNNKWNQTGDLTIPTDGKNLFTVPSGSWDGATTTWSTK